MSGLFEELRNDPDMRDFEYRHAWADAHLNSMIAMQIKVLREQRDWTQTKLAEVSEMAQSRISLLEDVNYSAWSISTLKRLAKAYDLRLKVSFEEFGSLDTELATSGKGVFERRPFGEDPKFNPELADAEQVMSAEILEHLQQSIAELLNNLTNSTAERLEQAWKSLAEVPKADLPIREVTRLVTPPETFNRRTFRKDLWQSAPVGK